MLSRYGPGAGRQTSTVVGLLGATCRPVKPVRKEGEAMASTDDYRLQIGDVIAQVNAFRMATGHQTVSELPTAHQGDPAACLFYRALADCGAQGVYGDSITFSSERQAMLAAELWGTRADGNKVRPPAQMRKTISDFDNSKFAHYSDEIR